MATHRTSVEWTDRDNPVVKKLIDLKKTRASLRTMRDCLDGEHSYETIRKGLLQIEKAFGKRIFKPEKKEWTAQQIAKKIRRTSALIIKICSSGEITGCRKQGENANTRWLIDETGVQELRSHPLIYRFLTCSVCKRQFKFKKMRPKTCSKKCYNKRNNQLRAKLITKKALAHKLTGKALSVFRAIKRCSKNTPWVTIGQAANKTKLTEMQVRWYVMRGIITSKRHPTRRSGRGGKVMLCALNQVKVMARIIAS